METTIEKLEKLLATVNYNLQLAKDNIEEHINTNNHHKFHNACGRNEALAWVSINLREMLRDIIRDSR